MALEEYKSTLKRGRSKLRSNPLHASDPMRLSIRERLREKRFAACAREILLMTLDNRLDSLAAEFVNDLDALTKAGGDVEAFYGLQESQRGPITYACRHATWEIKYVAVEGLTDFKIIEDLQARAQKLLADPARLTQMQCLNKWWHY